jgi:hypothetical protein
LRSGKKGRLLTPVGARQGPNELLETVSTEFVQSNPFSELSHGNQRVSAGKPKTVDILRASHPASFDLFNDFHHLRVSDLSFPPLLVASH